MSLTIKTIASASLLATLGLAAPSMAETSSAPQAETQVPPPPATEDAQSAPEAQTTPGVDDAQGDTEPSVAGSQGPGYGNSGEPEAAPAQPPVQAN